MVKSPLVKLPSPGVAVLRTEYLHKAASQSCNDCRLPRIQRANRTDANFEKANRAVERRADGPVSENGEGWGSCPQVAKVLGRTVESVRREAKRLGILLHKKEPPPE